MRSLNGFYALMQLLERERSGTRGGFVPCREDMAEEELVLAGRIVLAVVAA
jgi:hypothetical protein